MTRVWRYCITHDTGSAPNYEPPMTTLTVCKPRIRRSASIGDVVMAFAGANLVSESGIRWTRHEVVWAGVVAEIIPLAEYWSDERFEGKKPDNTKAMPDNFYRPVGTRLEYVPNVTHAENSHRRDTGGRNALAMSPAWRFDPRQREMPEEVGLRLDRLNRRGERISDFDELEIAALLGWFDTGDDAALVHARLASA